MHRQFVAHLGWTNDRSRRPRTRRECAVCATGGSSNANGQQPAGAPRDPSLPPLGLSLAQDSHFSVAARIAAAPAVRREKAKALDAGLQVAAERGARLSAVDLMTAEGERALLAQKTNTFLTRYDLLLTPTVAVPALPVGQDLNDPKVEELWIDWTPFSYPFNMSRQPAANIPCGFTASGLPVGLQAVAALDCDALVLRVARAYEAAHPFVTPRVPHH